MAWNVDRAIQHAQNNAQPNSIGRCARYTVNAIEAGGVRVTRTLSAKDLGPSLEAAGFHVVDPTPETFQKGDVAIIEGFNGHPHGHAQIYDGTQWISDFRQRTFYPGQAYRNAQPGFKIYRYNSL